MLSWELISLVQVPHQRHPFRRILTQANLGTLHDLLLHQSQCLLAAQALEVQLPFQALFFSPLQRVLPFILIALVVAVLPQLITSTELVVQFILVAQLAFAVLLAYELQLVSEFPASLAQLTLFLLVWAAQSQGASPLER